MLAIQLGLQLPLYLVSAFLSIKPFISGVLFIFFEWEREREREEKREREERRER
jgi:hypothetical protein